MQSSSFNSDSPVLNRVPQSVLDRGDLSRTQRRMERGKTVLLPHPRTASSEELENAKPLAHSFPNPRRLKEGPSFTSVRQRGFPPVPAARSPEALTIGSSRLTETRNAQNLPSNRPAAKTNETHAKLIKNLTAYLSENEENPSTKNNPGEGIVKLSPIKENGLQYSQVKAYDCRGTGSYNLFHEGHVLENLGNTFTAVEHFLDRLPAETPEKKKRIEALKERLNNIKESHEVFNINRENLEINTDITSKTYAKDAAKSIDKANHILADCFSEVSRELGISVKQLEGIVGQHNSQNIGKQTLTTIYELEIDGKIETLVEIAEPQWNKMHTSADRSASDISNFYKRSIYKVEKDGSHTLTELSGGLKTHSSLPTITKGEMELLTGKTTKDLERFQGSIKAFEQVLKSLDPVPDTNGGEVPVIKITQATLFTAAKQSLDSIRKMESEWLMLQETTDLYNLYDGQIVEIEIDGKKVKVKVEIEHINAGSNNFATNDMGPLLDKELEKSVNDQGISKILSSVQDDLKLDIPPELKEKQAKCQEKIDQLKEKHSADLIDLRNKIKNAKTEGEFVSVKEKNRSIKKEISDVYGEMAGIHEEIFNATQADQKTIIKEDEKTLTRLEKLLEESPEENKVEIQNQINLLKNQVAKRQVYLEVQDLYFSGSYRDADKIHSLQLGVMLLGELKKNNVLVNCKSGEDRTGRIGNLFNLVVIAYGLFNRIPNLSEFLSDTTESVSQNKANTFFNDPKNHIQTHQFGAAAQINNANSPGAGGLQIGKKVNPLLGDIAKVSKKLAGMAKTPYKRAKEIFNRMMNWIEGPTDKELAKEISDSLRQPKEPPRFRRPSDLELINSNRRSSSIREAEGRRSFGIRT